MIATLIAAGALVATYVGTQAALDAAGVRLRVTWHRRLTRRHGQILRHHGDPRHFADELATEYGEHPETAAVHMAACLAITPGVVEIPEWPERDDDGALYTGMGDER